MKHFPQMIQSRQNVPDFALVTPEGVLQIESRGNDVPLEDVQLKCSALSKTGRPVLLLVDYPAYVFGQAWIDGLGGAFVRLPLPHFSRLKFR